MDPVIERLMHSDMFLPLLVVSAIVVTSIVKSVTKCFSSAFRERTRREIAAYIAEGSITPDQGERLMKADPKSFCG